MKFEKTEVFNFDGALRGMRNPMNSWDRSDSGLTIMNPTDVEFGYEPNYEYIIGENDLNLAQRLIKGGNEHRKFLRQIIVSVDITAPLYYWKEFDQYKINVTTNSTSTMHKLTSHPITLECFEIDDYDEKSISDVWLENEDGYYGFSIEDNLIPFLEMLRQKYLETKDKKYWKELVRWLPESWLQTRTVTMNYENLRNMYFQRKNHKLTEWSESFIKWVESLPYAKELIMYKGE